MPKVDEKQKEVYEEVSSLSKRRAKAEDAWYRLKRIIKVRTNLEKVYRTHETEFKELHSGQMVVITRQEDDSEVLTTEKFKFFESPFKALRDYLSKLPEGTIDYVRAIHIPLTQPSGIIVLREGRQVEASEIERALEHEFG